MAQPFKSSPNYLKSKKDHQLGIEPSVKITEKEGQLSNDQIKPTYVLAGCIHYTVLYN